jgi:DNA repair protein RadC
MATRIVDLPAATRPREKLLARGAAALADAELVALLLRTGTRGVSALDLAATLIRRYGGLHGLLHADAAGLRAVPGLGPAKYAELAAVLELARRALAEPLPHRDLLESPQATGDYLRLWLGGAEVEVFAALFLDTRHQLISARELWRGSLAQASVYPREIVKLALALNAAALIVAHNHPSGVAEPSVADRQLTARLKEALALVDVRLLDHLVVTRQQVFSFAGAGLM